MNLADLNPNLVFVCEMLIKMSPAIMIVGFVKLVDDIFFYL